MGKPHPIELRERVVAFVEDGNTHHAAATHFRVSVKFVNDMVILKHRTGSLKPRAQGHGGWSKLGAFNDWARARLKDKGDLTLDDLVRELHEDHGLKVARSSVGYWLHRLGLSHKKKRCCQVSKDARMWRKRCTSGSPVVNHSCATIWKGSHL